MRTKFLNLNDAVEVGEPREDDLWNHSFTGNVIKIKGNTVTVEDQEGNAWDVNSAQVYVLN